MSTKSPRAAKAQSLTSREFDLITRFRGIPEEAQQHVLAIARTVEPAAEAQSNDAIIAKMVALEPVIRKLLEGVNAIVDSRPDPAPAATSRPEPDVPPEVRHVYLECALRHLRCADSLLVDGKPATAEMEDVAEVIRSAAENLTTWLDGITDGDPHDAQVFDALDACTVATALIEAGLHPRNSKTVSPIKGVLRLGADRLAEVAETEGRSGREAIRAAGAREAAA